MGLGVFVSSSDAACRAKNAIATEALAAANRGLRNRLTPIIGAAVARAAATSAASDSVEGNVIAVHSPITARAAVSCPGGVANDPAQLQAPNTARPASSIPLRPSRSARLPGRQISAD